MPGHPWQLAIPAEAGTLTVSYTTAYPDAFGIDVQGIYLGTVTSQQSFSGTATEGYSARQMVNVTLGSDSVGIVAGPLETHYDLFLPLARRP